MLIASMIVLSIGALICLIITGASIKEMMTSRYIRSLDDIGVTLLVFSLTCLFVIVAILISGGYGAVVQ